MSTDLQQVRSELEGRLEQLKRRTQRVGSNLRGRRDADSGERAQEVENDEVLEGLEGGGLQEIAQIEGALRRLAEGNYGTCTGCSGQIDGPRLAALPYTPSCRACAV